MDPVNALMLFIVVAAAAVVAVFIGLVFIPARGLRVDRPHSS